MPGRGNYWKPGGLIDGVVRIEDLHPTASDPISTGLWKEVGTVTVTTGTSTLLEVDNIPNSSIIKFFWRLVPTGGTNALLRFNDDSGNAYIYRQVDDNGTLQDVVGQPLINLSVGGGLAENEFFEGTISNVSGKEKLMLGELIGDQAGTGTGTPPRRRHINGKYISGSLITKISVQATAGAYGVGTELSVFVKNSS